MFLKDPENVYESLLLCIARILVCVCVWGGGGGGGGGVRVLARLE